MFRVGAVRYTLRITREPIVLNGKHYLGLCVESSREILISPEVAIDQRRRILFHELVHAHLYAHGRPDTEEGLCDFAATFAELAMVDLMAVGGEEALKRLGPGEELSPRRRPINLSRSRSCRCGGTIPPGEIRCEQDDAAPDQVKLSMTCPHCDITIRWRELMTFGGLPSGVVVGEPQVERAAVTYPL
jgi:hypothetical protein